MKKVIIIGAGIAGLTCGIYAQLNGFETEIYELHTIAGGECTGWDRGGYHFDGCIHWMVGTKPGTSLNKIWRDTGALDASVRIINHDVYTRYEEGDAAVNFYTDTNRLEKHLIEIAPEDKKAIRKLCNTLRGMGGFGMPTDKPMDMFTAMDGLKFAAKNIGSIAGMSKYSKMSMKEFAAQFKSPLLKRALLDSFPDEYSSMAFISTLSGMNAGDCGFPVGGSRALAKRMEKRYLSLGGKVFYQSKVEKILVENGKAAGIRLENGDEARADHVVSCADGYDTFMRMLDDKYTTEQYRNLFSRPKEYPTPTSALVFMGVNAKIPLEYRCIDVCRSEPVTLGGQESKRVALLHYGFDSAMAPEGKTVMACFYSADFDYWNDLYGDKEKYKAEKKRLEEDAIAELVKRYPEAEGKIEVTDVSTPMTYVRYCNAWRGSWMTWTNTGKDIPQYFSGVLPGLENFILAGMWTLPPGGLPGAGASGKFAAQRLCIQNGITFKN